MTDIHQIVGDDNVVNWFGYWPTFHDAVVVDSHLNCSGPCSVTLHTWNMTNDVDARGYYILDKHAIVTFEFGNVKEIDFGELDSQQVINSLVV
jgi:hypothetical protein